MQGKTLLVCGSGRTLFSDIADLGVRSDEDLEHYDVMAINEVGLALPKCQHWASFHAEKFEAWLTIRKTRLVRNTYQIDYMGTVTHSQRKRTGVKQVWVFPDAGGTSVLYGVQIGLHLDYERIICCGAPMDASGRFYEPPWRAGHDYKVTDGWGIWRRLNKNGTLANVKAMSGCTRELLGPPPQNWYVPNAKYQSRLRSV